jgi:hypothetical protein
MSYADRHYTERLRSALRRAILLRETGPKSAAWHRARMQLIWRLHDQLEREQAAEQPVADNEERQAAE